MDSVKLSSMAPKKGRFARSVAKVLHLRAATGIASVYGVHKLKSQDKVNDDKLGTKKSSFPVGHLQSFKLDEEDQLQMRAALDALLAKLFASVSSIKAAYAQLQCAQSPYDADGIHAADRLVISELKNLSEWKQCFVKKQFDPCPETAMLTAEVQELKSISKTYEITASKLQSQLRLKDSEIMYLKEKLEESCRHNRLLERRLNQGGQLPVPDNLHQTSLSCSHFIAVVQFTAKSIRSFVRLVIDQMKAANWDLDAAANAIVPDVIYPKADDKCFAVESFVSRKMFEGFHLPNFGLPSENKRQLLFRRFTELKSVKAKDYLTQKPKSTFANFCRTKYSQLVHPDMETSFFGNLSQRNLLNSGGFPDTTFFTKFAEAAKHVLLLHYLAFSFDPEASIFRVRNGCRFSEVFMECVAEEALLSEEADPPVAFTVFPGFKIGQTIIQCQVYLSPITNKVNH